MTMCGRILSEDDFVEIDDLVETDQFVPSSDFVLAVAISSKDDAKRLSIRGT
jgi:hypothetical protein